ncbi:olfactory receptor 10A3-like [Pelmatolapia mariae]|uniref:olfactory receptor 10A3-like n=1 Tax=Pelmatolapia mariae TaxID=158779 RepID=UPI002FE5BC69
MICVKAGMRTKTNSTQVLYFTLTAYFDTGLFKYLYFIIVMSLYMITVGSNVLLIVVICVNRSLHEPMYMFLCSLFVNELYGSTGLFPFLLLQILSDVHTVSAPLCFLQVYCLCVYGSVEFFILGVMSYDRYLAICYPLHYNTRMTCCKVVVITAFMWLYSALTTAVVICLSASLQLCGNIIYRVYCHNSMLNLICSDTPVNDVLGYLFSLFLGLVLLIIYSYMRILKVCFSGSKQTRQKAVSTCTPHLASLLNFSFGCFFDVLQSWFDMSRVPNILCIFLSLYYITCQPLFNPLIYGLKVSKICSLCKAYLQ